MDATYPGPECPDCGGCSDAERPVKASRQFGPGEWAHCRCTDCGYLFTGIVPEPPDDYAGDGRFAESH